MLSYRGVHRWNCTPPLAGNLIDAVNSGDNKRAVLEDSGFEFLEMFYG